MNFTSGGTIEGTISAMTPPAPPSGQPPKPPGIPEHYIFDDEVELWMPPSAIAKAAAHALVPLLSGPSSGITVIKSGDTNPAPYTGGSNDPICFEFTNTGVCSRLNGGQICRYRHLQANHPDVIADKVRQGKLPPSVLEAGLAPTDPGIPPDPGHGAQLCFDFINSGSCGRLTSGVGCKYRHLAQGHPDVIADKVRQGKLNPAMAAQLLTGAAACWQVLPWWVPRLAAPAAWEDAERGHRPAPRTSEECLPRSGSSGSACCCRRHVPKSPSLRAFDIQASPAAARAGWPRSAPPARAFRPLRCSRSV